MDMFNLIFMCLMTIGFITIIYSLVKLNKLEKSVPLSSLDKSLSEVKNALNEADIAIEDLNLISEEMFSQFEKKKKELMFLYEAIENKRNNINKLNLEEKHNLDIKLDKFSPIEKNYENNKINHPLLPKIKKLLDENYSLNEIAKELNIGQGELDFIIKLGME